MSGGARPLLVPCDRRLAGFRLRVVGTRGGRPALAWESRGAARQHGSERSPFLIPGPARRGAGAGWSARRGEAGLRPRARAGAELQGTWPPRVGPAIV